jgi:hypothetical protein
MTEPFTPDDIARLSAEIDRKLLALGTPGTSLARGDTPEQALPETQRRALEQATGEDAMRFLKRFKRAAHRDLCEEGGVLYTQWQKWKDVSNKDLLRTIGPVLAAMGLTGGLLQTAAVAVAIYILYLGIQAFCTEV